MHNSLSGAWPCQIRKLKIVVKTQIAACLDQKEVKQAQKAIISHGPTQRHRTLNNPNKGLKTSYSVPWKIA